MNVVSDLLEVHSVRVFSNQIGDTGTGEIYGRIRLKDFFGVPFDLFNQTRDNAVSTFQDGTLPLEGPDRCIDGREFTVVMQLKEKHEDQDRDLDVCSGRFVMAIPDSGGFLDAPVRGATKGKDGFSVLHFRTMSSAIQANVEVTMITNEDNQTCSHFIHGSVSAHFSRYKSKTKYDDQYYRTTLLNVPKDTPREINGPGINDGKRISITLSRHVVAITKNSRLVIEADLFDNPRAVVIGALEPKRLKVSDIKSVNMKGTVSFVACPPKDAEDNSHYSKVGSPCNGIEVKVTFACVKD